MARVSPRWAWTRTMVPMENEDSGTDRSDFDLTRRALLKLSAAAGGALVAGHLLPGELPGEALAEAAPGAGEAAAVISVLLRVNGAEHRLSLDPRTTLLDALREHLHLNGTKKGCGL